MTPATINTSTLLVDNGVTGSVTYSAGSHTAVFVPSAPLAYNTTYTATVTTGVQDGVGLPMAANFTWSITTGAPPGGSGDGGGGGCFVGAAASRKKP
jgi:nicotinamide mononucleotide (NMN) deamidase PncC